MFRNMAFYYSEELLAPCPTPKLEDHPLSAVCDCLFNIFAVTLHIGGRSSIFTLRTHRIVVTGTDLSWDVELYFRKFLTAHLCLGFPYCSFHSGSADCTQKVTKIHLFNSTKKYFIGNNLNINYQKRSQK